MSEWVCVCCRKSFRKALVGPDRIFTGICPTCDIQLEREAQEMREQLRPHDETSTRRRASGAA
ncbi:MAG: hypothetical protein HYV08_11380 [Deltaproteobacteria bacterium]|nr:hypothetical protein [Deltaproteobacteria bacterium]MBI3079322.1 hypothetical protein [Deltaproteobacteria bacterium]